MPLLSVSAQQRVTSMFWNRWKKRQTELLSEREDQPGAEFLPLDIDQSSSNEDEIMRCVLSELQGYLYERELPLKTDDELSWLFGIDEDEIIDLFEKVTVRLNCPQPDSTYALSPIRTVGDLIDEVRGFCSAQSSARLSE